MDTSNNNISSFLVPFFKEMKERDFLWAVAHGWEGLPEYTRHDVDLYVEKSGIVGTIKIIKDVALQSGWKVFGIYKKSIYTACLLYREYDGNKFRFLQLDLFSGKVTRGVPCAPDPIAWLERRWLNEKGIWCANLGMAGASVLIKELVHNGVIERATRHQQIVDAVKKCPADFKAAIYDYVKDNSIVDRICELSEREAWDELVEMTPILRRSLPKLKWSTLWVYFKWGLASLKVRLFPFFKFFIVFIGPDGCGKTTIADNIEKYLLLNPFSDKVRIHSGFSALPRLRTIYAKVLGLFGKKVEFKEDPKPGTRGMGMLPPFPVWKSILYIIYYGLNAIFWWIPFMRIYPYFTLVIADRYYYDYYYMRGYIKCPYFLKKAFSLFMPKPNLIFYLERDANKIYMQKPELDVDEIKRQQETIIKTMHSDCRFHVIEANEGIEQTTNNVITVIRDYMRTCMR